MSDKTTVDLDYPILPTDRRPSPVEILYAALTKAWAQAPYEIDGNEGERLVSVLSKHGYRIVDQHVQ